MAAATGAYVYKDALITVEGTDYANQLSKAVLVPDTPVQTYRTLVPDGSVVDVDSPAWTFEVSALQINIAGGLAKALRDASPGDDLDIVLVPKKGSGNPQASFTIKAAPVDFGGEQGGWQTFEKVFGVVGSPVFGTAS
jgi:hypothetical protein